MRKNPLRLASVSAVIAGLALTAVPIASFGFVSVGVSITVAPPALPVYVQPPCPGIGYIWTPGYWAWDDDDYYWVPGTWVLAPSPGLLWTPGYWGWGGGLYVWHPGYWGPHVGFYGGINYGYGYTGVGFQGGYWRGRDFYYNRAVNNFGSLHVTNVYNTTVVNNVTVNRVSFNGGAGTHARPTGRELSAERERHVDFTPMQRDHEHMAFGNHDLRASVNGGKPRIAATARPAVFTGRDVIGARAAGAPYHGGGDHGAPGRGAEMHAGDHGGPGAGRAADARTDRPSGAHGGDAHVSGPGRAPDLRAGDHGAGATGRGDATHATTAMRNDRPPGATGAGRGAEFHTGGGQGPDLRGDRPGRPENHDNHAAAPGTGASNHGDVARSTAMRSDRPPGAGGSAAVRGGAGGGADFHSGGPAHDSHMARNDRPPNAGGGTQFHSEQARAPQVQPHVNQMNQMRPEHSAPQAPRPSGNSPQATPRQFNGGGQEFNRGGGGREFGGGGGREFGGQPAPRPQAAAPRPQPAPQQFAAPRQEMSRPQAAPQQFAAPRQEMPRQEMRGGGEPRGQGRPQQESRGPHDRR